MTVDVEIRSQTGDQRQKATEFGHHPVTDHHLLSQSGVDGQLAIVELVTIDPGVCIRCAACAVVAPSLFDVSRKGSRLRRQPSSDDDHQALLAAAAVCPTRAISTRST